MRCYNFLSFEHLSRDCNQTQKLTRCHFCGKVCTKPESHAPWCGYKFWTSKHLLMDGSQAIQPQVVAKIGFEGVNSVTVLDNGLKNQSITFHCSLWTLMCSCTNTKSAWFALRTLMVLSVDRHTSIFLLVIFRLFKITTECIQVNERYMIDENICRVLPSFNVKDSHKIALRVDSDSFKVKFYLTIGTFSFNVSALGLEFDQDEEANGKLNSFCLNWYSFF